MSDTPSEPYEHIQFLSRSRSRVCLLRCLNESPKRPHELTHSLDISRRGVHRHLSAVVERGWAEKADGEYRLTPSGALITGQYVELCTTLDTITAYEPFFTHLPDLTHFPSPAWLHDAEIVVPTEEDPSAPIRQCVHRLRNCSSTTIRSILPGVSQSYTEIYTASPEQYDETELIVDTSTLEAAQDRDLEAFCAALPDSFALYEHPETIDVGLTLTDQCGFMCSYDAQGRVRATIECDDVAFLDWATGLYHRYRNRSRAINPANVQCG